MRRHSATMGRRQEAEEEKEEDVKAQLQAISKAGPPVHVLVHWEGAERDAPPLRRVTGLGAKSKVALLRKRLQAAACLPAHSPVYMLAADGSPLNEVQEALCSLAVFGPARPVRVRLRIGQSEPQIGGSGLGGGKGVVQAWRKQQEASNELKAAVRDVFAHMLHEGGRSALETAFERFDSGGSDTLKPKGIQELLEKAHANTPAASLGLSTADLRRHLARLDSRRSFGDASLSYAELAACLPPHLTASSVGAGRMERPSNQGAEQALDALSARLAGLQATGFRRSVLKACLKPTQAPETKPAAAGRESEWQKYCGSASANLPGKSNGGGGRGGDEWFLHPASALVGRVEALDARTGRCVFHAKVDLDALFDELDPTLSGFVTFDALAELLSRLGCGATDLEVSQATLREALQPFKIRGGYDYLSLINHCLPLSEQARSAAVEAIVGQLRARFMLDSFGGLDVRRAFSKFDPKAKGSISVADLRCCLRDELKVKAAPAHVRALLEKLDPKRNLSVSYADFAALLERGGERWGALGALKADLVHAIREQFYSLSTGKVDVEAAFAYFDSQDRGFVSEADMVAVFQRALDGGKPKKKGVSEGRVEVLCQFVERRRDDVLVPGKLHRMIQAHPTRILSELAPEKRKSDANKPALPPLGLELEGFRALLETESPPTAAKTAKKLRDKVREVWRAKADLSEIYAALQSTEEEKRIEAGMRKKRMDRNGVNCLSLIRGAREALGLNLSLQEASALLAASTADTIAEPRTYLDFLAFCAPGAEPSESDVAAQVRSALRRGTLGGLGLPAIFASMDRTGRGTLTPAELHQGLLALQLPGLSSSHAHRLAHSALICRGGAITSDAFVHFILSTPAVDWPSHASRPRNAIESNPKLRNSTTMGAAPATTAAAKHAATTPQPATPPPTRLAGAGRRISQPARRTSLW